MDLRSRSKTPGGEISPKFSIREKRPPKRPGSATPYTKKQPSGKSLKYGLLKTMGDLPAVPEVVTKIEEIMANRDSSMREFAQIIEIEPGIATKVLQLVNSAYFGLTTNVSSIQRATSLLGKELLREVLTMAAISNLMDKTLRGYGVGSRQLWRHSLAVAFGSKLIARKRYPALEGEIFTAGLIHDVGKIILDQHVYEQKKAFEMYMGDCEETFLNAEKRILGFDHSEIASEFCLKWNLPEEKALAIRYHHHPSQSQGNILAYIIHMLDCMAMQNDFGYGIDNGLYQIEPGTREFLGLQEKDEMEIMSEVMESVQKAEQM